MMLPLSRKFLCKRDNIILAHSIYATKRIYTTHKVAKRLALVQPEIVVDMKVYSRSL